MAHSVLPLTILPPERLDVIPPEKRRRALLLVIGDRVLDTGQSADWQSISRVAARSTLGSLQPHASGCRCCSPQADLPLRLLGLLQSRARGESAFFEHVAIVSPSLMTGSIAAELAESPLSKNLFKVTVVQ